MAAELPRPGVEVVQEVRAVSPSVVSPTLVPCIIGACRQVVEVLENAALNEDAKVVLGVYFKAKNAVLSGTKYVYSGLQGKSLVLGVSNAPGVPVVFDGAYLTAAAVVEAINTALNTMGITSVVAEVAPEFLNGVLIERSWTLRSIATGSLQKVEIASGTDPEAESAFGVKTGWVYAGMDLYTNAAVEIPKVAFPDPRNNLAELAIDPTTLRVFFASNSANVRELQKKRGFCRRGSSIYAYDDGNGDVLTPFVEVPGANFSSTATASTLAGSTPVTSTISSLIGLTLTLQGQFDAQTYTFVNTTAKPLTSIAEAVTQLSNYFSEFTFTNNSGTLNIATKAVGQDARILVVGGTALEELGLSACAVGSVDVTSLTWGGSSSIAGKTLSVEGISYTFAAGQPTDQADFLSELNTAYAGICQFSVDASKHLVIQRIGAGSLVVGTVSGTVNSTLGLTVGTYLSGSYTAGTPYPVQAGDELFVDGKSLGVISQVAPGGDTSKLRLAKQVAMTTPATHTGSASLTNFTYPGALSTTTVVIDGVTCTFGSGAPTSQAVLLSTLSAAFPKITFAISTVGTATYLQMTKQGGGSMVVGSGTANSILGLTAGTYRPVVGTNYYIMAANLTGAATRPTPELLISSGVPVVSPNILRDTAGVPLTTSVAMYMMYKALRQDVSTAAAEPGLITFSSTSDLEDALAPLNTDNPLGLGLYLAMLNAPNVEVAGLGIDEVSSDMPEGTVEAFVRAAEFLEGVEVYALAPLTRDKTVADVFNTHVSMMSAPANKGERVVLMSTPIPTHQLDTLIASSAAGNSLGPDLFDTGIPNLSSLLLNAGVPNPVGTIDVSYGVFLDVASDGKSYSVQSVSGGVVTIRRTFINGDNDDGFYADSSSLFPPNGTPLINETFAIKIRGKALRLNTGKPDKANIALTLQQYAQTLRNRRFWHLVADKVGVKVDSVEQIVEPYYACAAYAGLVAGQPPQQSFTNFPLTGITRATGTTKWFTERQMDVIAGGGNWVLIQENPNTAVVARHALTTDMSSVETYTESVTKVVDFTAKIMRRGFRNYIGRFNITQGFMDSLGHVGQGILTFLMDEGVLIGGSLNNIMQDEKKVDLVLVDALLDPPIPCNYIRLTLVV